MSDLWRTRFAANLRRQHDACRIEAENRATGRIPTLEQYPALRRGTVGPYLYDLVEPCLRVEVPAWVHGCEPWQQLVDACTDVTAWCNDVASLPKERGDGHNLVVVVMHQLGLDQPEATAWVLDRIAERCQDMQRGRPAPAARHAHAQAGARREQGGVRLPGRAARPPRLAPGVHPLHVRDSRYRIAGVLAASVSPRRRCGGTRPVCRRASRPSARRR